MKQSPRHPDIVVALSIIRTRPEGHRTSAIRSIAMLTVTRDGKRAARFHCRHATFDPDHTRAEIIAGIAQRVPRGATVLIAEPPVPVHRLRYARFSGGVSPTDAELIARELRETATTINPVRMVDQHRLATFRSPALNRPVRASEPIPRRRRAAFMAQTIWATYVSANCAPAEQRVLLAAFDAWRALERARGGAR